MGALKRFSDGLVNIVANLGTGRDKAAHNQYIISILSPEQLISAYRTSWLAKAIVDYPAEDATRKWRAWQADTDQIALIEKLEKKLHVKKRVQDALVASRLLGGAAIYLNTMTADQESPLIPGDEEIKSLVVLTQSTLTPREVQRDIDSDYYGRPEYYYLSGTNAAQITIHASRLVIFKGSDLPADIWLNTGFTWGDSVLQSTMDTLKQTDSAMANMCSLVFEAKVDVFKFKGYAEMLADEANDALITRRLTMQAAMKGINGAVVIDSEDEYEQKSASFAGLPDVMTKFNESAAGAARIPVTRLFGRAAAGLSGSGDGDERVYFDRVGNEQATEIQPAMEILDECLIWQALGSRPEEVFYEWRPLRQITEGERADIFSKTASAARAIAGTTAGELIPLDALSVALTNELTEMGVLPGLEQAIKEYGTLAEQSLPPDNGDELQTTVRATDAEPMPLYVSRKVKNAKEILKHYSDQGVGGLIDAEKLHATITYSKTPVNWMKMGESWNPELKVNAGGARLNEVFGENKDTLVLAFASSELTYRHERMIEDGASWDWPEYQPHLSISYEFSGDASKITPWQGNIEFGPEIFEGLNEEWQSKGDK